MMTQVRRVTFVAVSLMVVAACGGDRTPQTVAVDGSSTVYPITEAMAEAFGTESKVPVNVTIATSGTGGGFKTFCAGERDISNASRPIKESEKLLCATNGVEYLELQVAIDGLSVVVNPANAFVDCLTIPELKAIWEPGSKVMTWSQVRPTWPNEPIKLYGAGTNSGTFDYFTEAVVGTVGSIRDDFSASEDDNVLVQGVEGDKNALGFFGYAYVAENSTRVKAVAVDGGAGCVAPTPETIKNGTFSPLSRPLYIYVSRAAWEREVVRDFVQFYLANAATIVPETGYIPLEAARYAEETAKLEPFGRTPVAAAKSN